MCARVAQLLLAALFVFVVATVAAFRYLEWWQAILASAATFVLLVLGAKYLIKSALGNLGNLAKGLFDIKSQVLRGATVQIHSVRPTEVPVELIDDAAEPDEDDEPPADPRDLAWYEIEATVFPDATAGMPMTHWDIDDLRLVPADAPAASLDDDGDAPEAELHGLRVVEDGHPVEPAGSKFLGPQRLHFAAGFPRAVRVAKFRYYFEDFGRVDLPRALPPTPRTP